MRILTIETSCDETAIAVLKIPTFRSGSRLNVGTTFSVLANQVSSQIKIHKPFGGVVPNLAKREHIKNLPILLKRTFKEANIQLGSEASKLDIIAVTNGPGLEPALWTGISFAKELSEKWKVPIVAVNHLEGHIYAAWLGEKDPQFPLLALIVSGGHTELVLMQKHLDYKILGETLDDAAGEAFDKVARMLGLGYPGGPVISQLAAQWKSEAQNPTSLPDRQESEVKFPRPMINSKDLNFSFSGLKTAVLYHLRDNPSANKAEIAYEFEQAVVDVLVKKTSDALRKYKVKSLVVGGGVVANEALRFALGDMIAKFQSVSLHISPLWLCGDNAAMIAVAAYFKAAAGKFSKLENIKADGGLKLG